MSSDADVGVMSMWNDMPSRCASWRSVVGEGSWEALKGLGGQ